ncbi:MAG TPA: DUF3107 domain-containing protein [Candidatus Nanopelagicaceae bacterium]|nr:DUF3107 domain-containing protein [Candidatus Nanopelagicaceae bacterium]
MEVKIGVIYSAKEIVLESSRKASEVEKDVAEALKSGGLLSLTDEKGRVVLIPIEKLAYLEIGEPSERRVGFGSI